MRGRAGRSNRLTTAIPAMSSRPSTARTGSGSPRRASTVPSGWGGARGGAQGGGWPRPRGGEGARGGGWGGGGGAAAAGGRALWSFRRPPFLGGPELGQHGARLGR